MFAVLVRPYDDELIADVQLVEHDDKTAEDFSNEWDEALREVKEKSPEEWQVTQVVEKMESKGWRMLCVNPTIVTY